MAKLKTLPDFLCRGLRVVSIGINPSLPSVQHGFYFANPRNRFWPALNASRLVSAPVTPGPGAMQLLMTRDGIGWTDLVKRPSAMASALGAADYRHGFAQLQAKLLPLAVPVLWLQGKTVLDRFRQYGDFDAAGGEWGWQENTWQGAKLFVSPNPSPANAAFSLQDLIHWFNVLADGLARPL